MTSDQSRSTDSMVRNSDLERGAIYSKRVQCSSCHGSGTAGEHGCTDCLGKGLDQMAFVGGIEGALNDAYAEGRRDEQEELASVLPGVTYMDPPDGGDASLLKQLQRMSNDAARYRLLRRKFAIISDGDGNAEFCPINLPRPTYIAPNTAIELDTALDRERLGMDGAERPPTPVGWSDTDWIKHLQEQDEQPHPLAGQHINQGSMDAAADAYEAGYNAARGISEADKD